MQRSTIERAFEVASSGECRTLDELKRRLRREQLEAVDFHLAGKSIKAQLSELMARAHAGSAEPGAEPAAAPIAQ
jgi:hypothetical protein